MKVGARQREALPAPEDAQYAALILGALIPPRDPAPRLACVVVYLGPRGHPEDPGVLRIRGELGFRLSLRYHVVKLWEVDPQEITRLQSPGLLPFLPLLRGNPKELLVESRQRILCTPDAQAGTETKRDLLAILGALSARVIANRDLIASLLSEIRGMEKPNLFFELIREEGREEEARRAIERILGRRFGADAVPACSALYASLSLADLENLIEEAALCPDLEQFVAKIPAA